MNKIMMNGSIIINELSLERQGIICLLEERDNNNEFIVKGKEGKDCIEYKECDYSNDISNFVLYYLQ